MAANLKFGRKIKNWWEIGKLAGKLKIGGKLNNWREI